MDKQQREDRLSLIYSKKVENVEAARNAKTFKNIEDFERHLLKNEPEIVELLQNEENLALKPPENLSEEQASTSSTVASEATSTATAVDVVAADNKSVKPKPTLVAVKKKVARTVLTKLENCEYVGPLSLLCRCVHEKLKVKVWIRGRAKIRSHITCYLAAFDCHWNLAVTDVDEFYYKKTDVSIFRQNSTNNPNTVCTDVPASLYYVSVDKHLANHELVRRHVSQMFVKGDNVVMVSIIR